MRRPFFLFILFNLSLPAAVSGEFLERSDAYGRIWESRTPPDGMKQDVSHNHLVFVFLAFLVLRKKSRTRFSEFVFPNKPDAYPNRKGQKMI
ncbi:Protein CBG23628 [Caenorhabditis briggsae]|uniref:Protein CBG23628 n=1 Tax=Caenorhabditis briggsae TaxID=6238 RepID=A8WIZ1_CAEBR|nr:Protein CBG23628 [Caenorhabditis briggsae]CAP20435.2 Protein CBG23628 [Caenorhabditis briggsae]